MYTVNTRVHICIGIENDGTYHVRIVNYPIFDVY